MNFELYDFLKENNCDLRFDPMDIFNQMTVLIRPCNLKDFLETIPQYFLETGIFEDDVDLCSDGTVIFNLEKILREGEYDIDKFILLALGDNDV
ncbi:hypothetical protein DFR79_13241 [Halanaerobium saccharolyticum]|uniref:Uncharacterized protein n=1 Tax=Halanaerobium saccharolyticum TaxID=43595 RepID=A0A4R6LEW3_9FIRM|nr:hypothetical protein [Halanaerobium saccharolyticum]TDO77709.1 hypothetical protein DFR79_13241 [Halanaerobium saccharolyticum]